MTDELQADRLLARLRLGPVVNSPTSSEPDWSGITLTNAVAQLETRGYTIVREEDGTYHLESAPDLLLADEIEPALAGLRFGTPLFTYGRLGSTNETATYLAAAEAPEGTLVTAEEQVQGRGRQGKSWHSPPGVGIWMSLVLRPEFSAEQAAGIPLAAALAVAAGLQEVTGTQPQIKWPNDVYMDGRKIAGVLGESAIEGPRVRHAVVGIGINVNLSADQLPDELRDTAGSMAIATGRTWNRVDVLAAVIRAFESRYDAYSAQGFDALGDEFRSCSSLIGRTVHLELSGHRISGTVMDLAADGSLILATASGTERVRVGEASLRMV